MEQKTTFLSDNQVDIIVPAHGEFVALEVVIQGVGGRDYPFLLTIKEEECFLNKLPDGFDPSKISSVKDPSGKIVKKHLIQNNTRSIQVKTDKV